MISACKQVLNGKFLLRRCSRCNFQCFHSLRKENPVSLVRILLSVPGLGLGAGGKMILTNLPEVAESSWSRSKGQKSPARGYKFGRVCSRTAGPSVRVQICRASSVIFRPSHLQLCKLFDCVPSRCVFCPVMGLSRMVA